MSKEQAKLTDPAKVKRAAADPRRPGAQCKAEPGVFRPEVNPRRCEGKGDCVAVCPYGAFEVGPMPDETLNAMPFFTRLKLRAHGRKTAFTPRADACRACGLCVVACPERAIRLIGPDGRAVKAGIRRAATVSAQSQETSGQAMVGGEVTVMGRPAIDET